MSYINPAKYFPEKLTYWASTNQDGYGGDGWVAPVVMSCRWEDLTVEGVSPSFQVEKEVVMSYAKVFTATQLLEGAYVVRGISNEANPSRLNGPLPLPRAYIVRSTMQTTSVKGDFVENMAIL
jgi:hypothetical protein